MGPQGNIGSLPMPSNGVQVNMFKEDGQVLHFAAPKVQASVGANTYVGAAQAVRGPGAGESSWYGITWEHPEA